MGINSTGIIAVKEPGNYAARNSSGHRCRPRRLLPMDREVIHVLPQEYIVDDQEGILDPLGLEGRRLEAKVHIVTAAVTSAHNIVKCVNRAGLEVEDIVLGNWPRVRPRLPEERELGAVIIDIGGGTTDIALLTGNSVKHTAVLAVGAVISPATWPSDSIFWLQRLSVSRNPWVCL